MDGGTNGAGLLYRITTDGSYSVVYDFCQATNCTDGASPAGVPAFGAGGVLYGTTSAGGANNDGSVYELTP
jgi:uncharacterized repeat protein (TIGR03803 family)